MASVGAWAELDGVRVIGGSVLIPTYGAWVADVTLADHAVLGDTSLLTIGDLTLNGTAYRAANFAGARSARLVAGAGGWGHDVQARAYSNPAGVPSSMVIGDAAIEVGETVVVASPTSVGEVFVRPYGPASLVLRLLTELWYIDPAGVTQVGVPWSPAPITSDFDVVRFSGAAGHFEIATESFADWMPGRTFTTPTLDAPQIVRMVRHQIDASGLARIQVLA